MQSYQEEEEGTSTQEICVLSVVGWGWELVGAKYMDHA